ncbi:MAG TPA: hypothetical protein DEQ09_01885, partial [Bacteroidales bacterium]|nr:hypothetical protein [Bacteroidales bacterium]
MKTNIKHFLFTALLIISVLFYGKRADAQNNYVYQKVGPQPDGSVLVPTNQFLRPAGFQVYFPGRPVDIALIDNEKLLAVKNKNSLDLIRLSDRTIIQSLKFPGSGSSITGIYYSENSSRIYLTNASRYILIARISDENIMRWETPIVLPRPAAGGNPYPCGITLNDTEDKIFVTLSRNNSLAVINMSDTIIEEIPAGMAPYDVILKDNSKAYVSNHGGRQPKAGETTYNSSGSQILVDPKTGIANSGSVSVIDLNDKSEIKVIEVGLHPTDMVFNADKSLLFVACANSDVISVIDTKTDELVREISVRTNNNQLFGSSPNALTISPDGKYLYVANGTDNAICVIETQAPNNIAGYIPTGWYPGSIATNSTGTYLYVANVKGIGSRNQRTDRPGYNSHDHMGSISIIPVPGENELKGMTDIVTKNNSLAGMLSNKSAKGNKKKKVPVPQLPHQTSHFKHVVYIIKENRTYDQVFGDMPQGDGDT